MSGCFGVLVIRNEILSVCMLLVCMVTNRVQKRTEPSSIGLLSILLSRGVLFKVYRGIPN